MSAIEAADPVTLSLSKGTPTLRQAQESAGAPSLAHVSLSLSNVIPSLSNVIPSLSNVILSLSNVILSLSKDA